MLGMKGKSLNVKIVNDKLVTDSEEVVTRSPVENLIIAQGYAGLVKDTISDIAGTVVTAVAAFAIIKTTSSVAMLLAKKVLG